MKRFSWLLPLALALCAGLILTPGCVHRPQPDGTVDTTIDKRVITAAKVASYVGTAEALKQHPEWRAGFVSARDALAALETSSTVDMAVILAIVNRLPVKQLQSDQAKLLVTSAAILLEDYAGSLPLDRVTAWQPVAKAIREGIDLGLVALPEATAPRTELKGPQGGKWAEEKVGRWAGGSEPDGPQYQTADLVWLGGPAEIITADLVLRYGPSIQVPGIWPQNVILMTNAARDVTHWNATE